MTEFFIKGIGNWRLQLPYAERAAIGL